ncbi:response regulator receiver domain-containing protein [Flavobacterium chryseum]|nr:response regulator receiver domain-containing protein [Flavobacterium sp. P3160]
MISSEKSPTAPEDSKEREQVKIILAEDDKDDQELFIDALDAAEVNSEVVTVKNGQELVDTLKDKSQPDPDIIFIDIDMPVKDGKKALEEIKGDKELKDIPTVMLSTWSHPGDIEDTFDKGADLYIQKPNSFNGFVMILKKVFFLHWAKPIINPVKNMFFVSEKSLSRKE